MGFDASLPEPHNINAIVCFLTGENARKWSDVEAHVRK
jgi:hypothetical protein